MPEHGMELPRFTSTRGLGTAAVCWCVFSENYVYYCEGKPASAGVVTVYCLSVAGQLVSMIAHPGYCAQWGSVIG